MSTASDDVSSHNTESKGPIPTDIDNQPILWLGNPAHLQGLLDEFEEYIARAGVFQPLIQDRAVLCGSKLAVESVFCVPFVKGILTDKVGQMLLFLSVYRFFLKCLYLFIIDLYFYHYFLILMIILISLS